MDIEEVNGGDDDDKNSMSVDRDDLRIDMK